MKRVSALTLTTAVMMFTALGTAQADSATDMVVDKMAEGDVSAICSGGRDTITKASKEAVMSLAKVGKISGDFQEIGKKAGGEFYEKKC